MNRRRAAFYDGRSALRHEVEIVFGVGVVEIRGVQGSFAIWPVAEITAIEAARADVPARFKCREEDARLEIDDAATAAELCRQPGFGRRARQRRRRRGLRLVAVVAVIAGLLAGGVLGGRSVPAFFAGLVPMSWERSVGDRLLPRFLALFAELEGVEANLCAAPPGRRALDLMLRRIMGADAAAFRVEVADAKAVNAFTLPGGRIVLFRGLIAEARSADEVAGVLAHEIGHAIERHPMQAFIRQIGLSLLVRTLTADFGGSAAGGVLELALTLAYSREAEEEADGAAQRLLAASALPTAPFAEFFDRLAERERAQPGVLRLLSTHPPSERRALRFRTAAPPGAEPVLSDDGWQALQAICTERKPVVAALS